MRRRGIAELPPTAPLFQAIRLYHTGGDVKSDGRCRGRWIYPVGLDRPLRGAAHRPTQAGKGASGLRITRYTPYRPQERRRPHVALQLIDDVAVQQPLQLGLQASAQVELRHLFPLAGLDETQRLERRQRQRPAPDSYRLKSRPRGRPAIVTGASSGCCSDSGYGREHRPRQ